MPHNQTTLLLFVVVEKVAGYPTIDLSAVESMDFGQC